MRRKRINDLSRHPDFRSLKKLPETTKGPELNIQSGLPPLFVFEAGQGHRCDPGLPQGFHDVNDALVGDFAFHPH